MIIPIELENSKSTKYNIYIRELPKLEFKTKVAVITNPTISKLHLNKLLKNITAKELYVVTIPDGEEYKNLKTVESILDELFIKKLDRKSLIIAFGGGVIGDISGFCASIYQRGIDFIQIPTTLLAQVDSSVGGKTGVNNKFGKNLIGSFYQPKAVYIDIDFLNTLPKREFSAGVAEIIKMAVMFDRDFFEFLEKNSLNDRENLKKAIANSVKIKANVVNQDERESGIRSVLNYGHTFAHVIENETDYKKYLHGEAVAIGIVMANRLALKLNLISEDEIKRVEELLKKYNLPTKYNIKDIDSFYNKFFLDKKSSNNKIKFILPNGIGAFKILDNIDEKLVKDILNEYVGEKT
jgi:3-dehydroquinate synthase